MEYTGTTGKTVKAKCVKPKDCSRCRYKCSEHINDRKRQEVFDEYWKLDTYERKKDFICSRVKEAQTKTYMNATGDGPVSKKRKLSRTFTMLVDGKNM